MSRLSHRLGPLYTELKRRRMFRVVIVYGAAAVVVLEGTSNLASALNFPEWIATAVAVLLLSGLPVAVVIGWIFDITPAGFVRTEPRAATAETIGQAPKTTADSTRSRKSIAVLPFVDMSPEQDQEYFGDGIADEIINALTKLEDLHVVARTSSFALRGQQQEARAIGEKLNVGTLLEGSVRKVGNQVRITAQLVDVADGYHLWSERYDREMEDVFAIQDEVACAIVDILKVKLGAAEGAPIVRPGTESLEAYTLYLKGRYHWNKRTARELEKGIELFEQAIAIDGRYALAWAGLADSYSILGWYRDLPALEAYTKTVSAASSAVAVDDSLAEAYTSLAYARFMYGWDWEGAEKGFGCAIERNPDYAVARHWYGEFLMAMGRFEEALDQVNCAQQLDPLSLTIGFGVGWAHYFAGRYEEAIAQYKKTLERDPFLVLAPWFLGPAYVETGRYDDAIALYRDWIPRVQRRSGLEALLAHACALSGRRDEALEEAARLEERADGESVPPDYMALVYVGLGAFDRAFEWLERALEQRVWYLAFLKVDPAFAPLRSDSRYSRLLTKVGLHRTPQGRALDGSGASEPRA
jgi:TolB-like protein/Tfp pilus assembly protein PilF